MFLKHNDIKPFLRRNVLKFVLLSIGVVGGIYTCVKESEIDTHKGVAEATVINYVDGRLSAIHIDYYFYVNGEKIRGGDVIYEPLPCGHPTEGEYICVGEKLKVEYSKVNPSNSRVAEYE